ncbi:MAG: NusG domain II-containing protein [Roseburia sp.]
MNRSFGKNDIFLLLALAVACVLGLWALHICTAPGAKVQIRVDDISYGTYDLDENQVIPVMVDGVCTNVVVISEGQVRMEEADCPDQLCVRQHAISNEKESIICLPNRVVVTVLGTEDAELDAMVR